MNSDFYHLHVPVKFSSSNISELFNFYLFSIHSFLENNISISHAKLQCRVLGGFSLFARQTTTNLQTMICGPDNVLILCTARMKNLFGAFLFSLKSG